MDKKETSNTPTENGKPSRKEYIKQWKAQNKDKVAEHTRRYWIRRLQREGVINNEESKSITE